MGILLLLEEIIIENIKKYKLNEPGESKKIYVFEKRLNN